MFDRKNVIKGLESLHDRLLDAAKQNVIATLDASMVADALALLKEQDEPIEPTLNESHSYVSDAFKCGKCGHIIKFHAKYCEDCGQAVKWNDEKGNS